eukprot:GFUD01049134.1.p1 GENE.GFUD01049134.1~~GFUD01049134.1.p1  ORF type:complete len:670 (+),score=113.47 GFUD01049134.1:59-2011(+)
MHMDAVHKGHVFMCDQCDYSTRHKSNLNSHQKAKHEMRVYKCLLCDVTTSFKQYLQKHMKEKHGRPMIYFCSDCDYCNEDKQEYTTHKSNEHFAGFKTRENNSFTINQAKENTKTDSLLPSKEVAKTEVYLVEPKLESSLKAFSCESCDYSSDRKHNLTLHNKAVHLSSMDYYCKVCPFSTTMKGYLGRHMQLKHKEIATRRSYPLFTPKSELPEHNFFNVSGNRLPRLSIDGFILIMNKFFLNEKEEKCAYFYCADKVKHKCKVSAKAFVDDGKEVEPEVIIDKEEVREETTVPLSEVYVKNEHSDQGEDDLGMTLLSYQGIHKDMCSNKSSHGELFTKRTKKHNLKCDVCEYVSTSVGGLEKHRKVKHDNVTYSCDQCDLNVKYQASLRRHVKAVHEGKTFNCNYCDHKSSTASHLRIHIEGLHEGITYDCHECEKKFKQKGHLKIHDDTMHKGVTHSCTYCSYVSRQKGHLTHHIKTLHLGQPHKCDICGMIYAHNGQLKIHKLREHTAEGMQSKFRCDKCNFYTRKEIILTRHMQRKHEIDEGKKRKSKGQKRKSKKKNTKTCKNVFSVTEETYSVEMSEELHETKPAIEDFRVKETKQEEDLLLLLRNISSPAETKPNIEVKELLLDEDFIAETQFSVEINKSGI